MTYTPLGRSLRRPLRQRRARVGAHIGELMLFVNRHLLESRDGELMALLAHETEALPEKSLQAAYASALARRDSLINKMVSPELGKQRLLLEAQVCECAYERSLLGCEGRLF